MQPTYIRQQSFLEGIAPPENPRILRKEDKDKFILATKEVNANTFDLSDPKENSEYVRIMKECANKKLEVLFLSRHWDEEQRKMRAYVEWRINHLT